MEISSDSYKKIENYIALSIENNDYEFECLYKNILKKLNIEKFTQIFQYFKNNPNYTLIDDKETLDIRLSSNKRSRFGNYRVTVHKDDILAYCKTNDVSSLDVDYGEKRFIEKTVGKYEPFVLDNYEFIKFTLKYDTFVDDNEIIETLKNKLSKQKKNYRFKKRFTFLPKSKYFKIDLSIVKSSTNSLNIVESGLLDKKQHFEIEIELNNKEIDNKEDKKKIITELFTIIGNIVMIIDNNTYIMKSDEEEKVILNYLELTNEKEITTDFNLIKKNPKKYFIGVQPKTLELENIVDTSIVNITNNYCVTDKADGERYLLYVDNSKRVYLINNRLNIKFTGLTHNSPKTIIDGEYITKDKYGRKMDSFMAFDIYFLKGKNVSEYPLIKESGKTRLNLLNDFVKDGFTKLDPKNPIVIKAKEFYHDKIFKKSKKILEKFKNEDSYKIDGLIFTPTNLAVGAYAENEQPKLSGSWNRVFKWKPPEENTIDFLVKFQGDIEIGGIKSKLCILYVGYNENINIDIIKILNRDFEDKVYGLKEFAKCNLMYKNDKLFTLENEEINDNMIIECSYHKDEEEYLRWKPNRIRYDKTELYRTSNSISGAANDYTTARNVWNSIEYPITYQLIIGTEQANIEVDTKQKIENDVYYAREVDRDKSMLRPLLDFHNFHVKGQFLYNRFKGQKEKMSIYDIACGRGGDLLKWIKSDYKTVIASDINNDNLMNIKNGIYKRYNNYVRSNPNSKQKMLFLQLDASKLWNKQYINTISDEKFQNLAKIFFGLQSKSAINDSVLLKFHKRVEKQFDLVSCMFAIHYMFDNINSLRNCISNIDMLLKDGGYFFGTCLDGYLVSEKLKKKKKISGTMSNKLLWSIEKKYTDFTDFNQDKPLNNIGQKITVYVETINQQLDEYLVDYELLKYELAKKNIYPVKDEDLKYINLENIGSSTGSFEEIFNLYNKKDKIKMDKFKVNKDYSFLNRWFIFKKYSN
jgi:SAM-dependent methyltransferase